MAIGASRRGGQPRSDELTERRLPAVALAGIVLIGIGLVEAVVGAFASPALASEHAGHGDHLLAFIGMVLVLVGLLRAIATGGASGPGPQSSQEDPDAVR